MKDLDIIKLYTETKTKVNNDFVEMFNNSEPMFRETGKLILSKHKFKMINWWRKITNTEKYTKEYVFIWEPSGFTKEDT